MKTLHETFTFVTIRSNLRLLRLPEIIPLLFPSNFDSLGHNLWLKAKLRHVVTLFLARPGGYLQVTQVLPDNGLLTQPTSVLSWEVSIEWVTVYLIILCKEDYPVLKYFWVLISTFLFYCWKLIYSYVYKQPEHVWLAGRGAKSGRCGVHRVWAGECSVQCGGQDDSVERRKLLVSGQIQQGLGKFCKVEIKAC